MGAGRGQTRRAQVTATAAVAYDEGKWDEFVLGTGTKAMSVFEYYAPKLLRKLEKVRGGPGYASWEMIFRELLEDAVACGAVVLPRGRNVSSFEIIFTISDDGANDMVNVIRRPARDCKLVKHYFPKLDKQLVMGDVGPRGLSVLAMSLHEALA